MRKKKVGGLGATEWYAPNIDDNWESRDFEVELEPMTGREWQGALEAKARKLEGESASGRTWKARDMILRERIKSVRGYVTVRPDGTEVEATDAKSFIEAVYACDDAAELTVLDDILAAIQNRSHLGKGLKKKSEPGPASSPERGQTPRSGNGDAQRAEGKSEHRRIEMSHGGGMTGVAEWPETHPARTPGPASAQDASPLLGTPTLPHALGGS